MCKGRKKEKIKKAYKDEILKNKNKFKRVFQKRKKYNGQREESSSSKDLNRMDSNYYKDVTTIWPSTTTEAVRADTTAAPGIRVAGDSRSLTSVISIDTGS